MADRAAAPLLSVAVSSRALFDFEEENEIFKKHGKEEYVQMQRGRLDTIPETGVAFSLVKKLLAFNEEEELVRVMVASRNAPMTGLRVFRAIAAHDLEIGRGFFTRGAAASPYLRALGAHLFLSASADDVKAALDAGVPAAHVVGGAGGEKADGILRVAFDGDAVLFSDESERVNQERGLDAFREQEARMRETPLSPGPLKPFLDALTGLRARLGAESGRIRVALITARGAPAHERPIRTLDGWGVAVDEAFFMDGGAKQEIVQKFGADFFFDDNVKHVNGLEQGGHVPSGVMNE